MEGQSELLEEDRIDMVLEISIGRGGSSDALIDCFVECNIIFPFSFPFFPFFFDLLLSGRAVELRTLEAGRTESLPMISSMIEVPNGIDASCAEFA